LLIELLLLAVGLALLLAALFVRYRDIGQMWEVGLQLLFYSAPIIYPIMAVPSDLQALILSNPIAQIIQDARRVIIDPSTGTGVQQLDLWVRVIPFAIVAVTVSLGIFVFDRAADQVAERV
jgi:ABC-2 type transport system permease protein